MSTVHSSRKMMLVPLPMTVQRILRFTSDNVPTLTLFTFVVVQFVLNIFHYIPAKYWRLWVDRTRFVLKTLLDSDFRKYQYQIDILRQQLAEAERRNTSSAQELDTAIESNKNLKDRLLKLNQEADQKNGEHSAEVTRVRRQLDAQGRLLAETESLLETLRSGGEGKVAKLSSDEKRQFLEQISALEKHIASLTKERKDIAQEVANMKATHLSFQDRFSTLGQENLNLLHEKQQLEKQLEGLKTRESQLVSSRDQFLGRLNTELQNSSATQSTVDTLKSQLEEAATSKAVTERLLADAQQQLASSQAQSKESQDKYSQLQEKLKAIEETRTSEASRLSQTETSQHAEFEQMKARVEQLETSLAGTTKTNEELKHDVDAKNEEIARLTEALEHEKARHHKLIKPRHASHDSSSRPITPPPTISSANAPNISPSHGRSNSISSRLGFDRERKISFNKRSPSASPTHRAQSSLPSTSLPAPGGATGVPAGYEVEPADTSMASSVGSGTKLAPPSLGKSHRKSRQRLSSILGIHLGTPEKEK